MQTSLAEASMIAYKLFSMLSFSPSTIPMLEARLSQFVYARSSYLTVSDREELSIATKVVIIFVILAGYSFLFMFLSYNTVPDCRSMTHAASAETLRSFCPETASAPVGINSIAAARPAAPIHVFIHFFIRLFTFPILSFLLCFFHYLANPCYFYVAFFGKIDELIIIQCDHWP